MPLFPLFVDIKGKKCLVVGGGNTAFRKIEQLLRFGAKIHVVGTSIDQRISELAQNYDVVIEEVEYDSRHMESAFLAIGATDSPDVNAKVYEDASRMRIPVNVVDDKKHCSFVFPSLVVRGDLSVGISTSGAYPALSKHLRKRIDAILPESYSDMLPLLKLARHRVISEIAGEPARKRVMVRILELILDICDSGSSEVLVENFDRIIETSINEEKK